MWSIFGLGRKLGSQLFKIDDPFVKISGIEFGGFEEVTPIRIKRSRIIYFQPISIRILSELKDKNFQRYYAEEADRELERIKRDLIDVKGMIEEQADKEARDLLQGSASMIKGKAMKKVKERIPENISEASIVIVEGMLTQGQTEQLFVAETVEQLDKIIK